MIKSFPPISDQFSKILILGTMPGAMSLKLQQYYGHGGNHFWKILFELCEEPFSKEYELRTSLAIRHGVAIWDVLKACVREGSSDSAIVEEVPNEFNTFFINHPNIEHIYFNGKKPHLFFNKYVNLDLAINQSILPSTSSANTWLTYEGKLKDWMQILC